MARVIAPVHAGEGLEARIYDIPASIAITENTTWSSVCAHLEDLYQLERGSGVVWLALDDRSPRVPPGLIDSAATVFGTEAVDGTLVDSHDFSVGGCVLMVSHKPGKTLRVGARAVPQQCALSKTVFFDHTPNIYYQEGVTEQGELLSRAQDAFGVGQRIEYNGEGKPVIIVADSYSHSSSNPVGERVSLWQHARSSKEGVLTGLCPTTLYAPGRTKAVLRFMAAQIGKPVGVKVTVVDPEDNPVLGPATSSTPLPFSGVRGAGVTPSELCTIIELGRVVLSLWTCPDPPFTSAAARKLVACDSYSGPIDFDGLIKEYVAKARTKKGPLDSLLAIQEYYAKMDASALAVYEAAFKITAEKEAGSRSYCERKGAIERSRAFVGKYGIDRGLVDLVRNATQQNPEVPLPPPLAAEHVYNVYLAYMSILLAAFGTKCTPMAQTSVALRCGRDFYDRSAQLCSLE